MSITLQVSNGTNFLCYEDLFKVSMNPNQMATLHSQLSQRLDVLARKRASEIASKLPVHSGVFANGKDYETIVNMVMQEFRGQLTVTLAADEPVTSEVYRGGH